MLPKPYRMCGIDLQRIEAGHASPGAGYRAFQGIIEQSPAWPHNSSVYNHFWLIPYSLGCGVSSDSSHIWLESTGVYGQIDVLMV